MSKNTGGPAFPSHGAMGEVVQEGMSLRDKFADSALAGILGTSESLAPPDMVARAAYEYADAMLEERAK